MPHVRHRLQVRGDEAVCTCNNSCVLEGLALTVHIAHMRNEAPILADTDVAAITQVGGERCFHRGTVATVRQCNSMLKGRSGGVKASGGVLTQGSLYSVGRPSPGEAGLGSRVTGRKALGLHDGDEWTVGHYVADRRCTGGRPKLAAEAPRWSWWSCRCASPRYPPAVT